MHDDPSSLENELRDLLDRGRKIEAIKRYREKTGAGLAEAKAAVEAFDQGAPLTFDQTEDSDLEKEIATLLGQGKKIQAIKIYREKKHAGLKEAKDAVESIAAKRGIEKPSGSGCLGMLLLLGAVITSSLILVATFYASTCHGIF